MLERGYVREDAGGPWGRMDHQTEWVLIEKILRIHSFIHSCLFIHLCPVQGSEQNGHPPCFMEVLVSCRSIKKLIL